MATRTATKKTTKTTRRASGAKRAASVPLYRERNPENHQVTGKYKFFYALFACTTVIFAALAVWLFVFSSNVLNKYESIKVCARTGNTCEVSVSEEGATTDTAGN